MKKLACAALAVMWAGTAAAQTPAFDPREWKGLQAGPPTQILVLGSAHLSQMAKPVGGAMMDALLDKLAVYKPDIITVEGISGEQCDHFQRYAGTYPGDFEAWCKAAEAIKKSVGLDVPAAADEIHKTLATWPKSPDPAARRHLALLFLRAGDLPSAEVQWLRLPPAERHADDGLTDAAAKLLDRTGAKPNETFDVAVALAVRLGLEQIYSVDDHTSDGALIDADDHFNDAVQAAWKIAPSKAVAQEQAMEAQLATPDDVLALYRFMNQPDTLRQNIAADFRANLTYQTPQLYGRMYVAAWEVRNLRMVANIRAAVAATPGARVLSIVGSSHKAYFDAYLDEMHDIKLVDAEAVLK